MRWRLTQSDFVGAWLLTRLLTFSPHDATLNELTDIIDRRSISYLSDSNWRHDFISHIVVTTHFILGSFSVPNLLIY